jgi:hypothetical protein
MNDLSKLAFFLGGHDLEMLTIRDLIAEVAPQRLFDKDLRWGAKASAYRAEIGDAVARGLEPVLVELEDDLRIPSAHIVVDHHGDRAGAETPTSLHQVFDLLRLPRSRWTRHFDLVAANDRGHIRELRRIGASEDEIRRIRAADRAAQGITPEDERWGEQALRDATLLANGQLLVVRLPHARTAVVADRVEMDRQAPENLLVLSPNEANFYGAGAVVAWLDERYPGGWSGGALPERGFWGYSSSPADLVESLCTAVEQARQHERELATTTKWVTRAS